MSDLDRGALAALDLLRRCMTITEDETTWEDHIEGITAVIKEGGIGLAIRREMEFEATLNDPDDAFIVDEVYGPFPPDLATALGEEPHGQ